MKLPSPIIQCHHHGINNRIALFVIDTQFRHLSLEVPVFIWARRFASKTALASGSREPSPQRSWPCGLRSLAQSIEQAAFPE